MNHRLSLIAALSLTVSLAACDAKSAIVPSNGTGDVGASTVASTPLSAAREWTAPAPATVWELAVVTKPKAGGPTLADIDKDTDFRDDVEPELDVEVKGGDGWASAGTLKARGHSTRESGQMSYAISLAKDAAPWNGFTSLQLNKHPYDLTRMRNKLGFDMLGYLPTTTASNTQFVHVTADGKDLGLFTMVEKVNKSYLKNHKLDAAGQLYKAESFDFTRHADTLKPTGAPGYDEKAFDAVISVEGAKDTGPLLALVDAVNDDASDTSQMLSKNFDRDNFVTWLASNVLTGNSDTVSQNFYLYRASTGGAWYFLPWDYDGGFGFYDQPDEKRNASVSGIQRWQHGISNWWDNHLIRRYLQTPGAAAELDAKIASLQSGLFSRAHLQAQIDSYKGAVGPLVVKPADASKLPLVGSDAAGEWNAEVSRLAGTVDEAFAEYQATKARPMPMYLGDPVGGSSFSWDASFSLAGHAITYDFAVSKTPDFGSVVVEKTGLTDTSVEIPALSAGSYFFRVIARDATDPANTYQYAFDRYTPSGGGKFYDGVKAFTVQ